MRCIWHIFTLPHSITHSLTECRLHNLGVDQLMFILHALWWEVCKVTELTYYKMLIVTGLEPAIPRSIRPHDLTSYQVYIKQTNKTCDRYCNILSRPRILAPFAVSGAQGSYPCPAPPLPSPSSLQQFSSPTDIFRVYYDWPCGPMDKASDYESGDCRFESCQGQIF